METTEPKPQTFLAKHPRVAVLGAALALAGRGAAQLGRVRAEAYYRAAQASNAADEEGNALLERVALFCEARAAGSLVLSCLGQSATLVKIDRELRQAERRRQKQEKVARDIEILKVLDRNFAVFGSACAKELGSDSAEFMADYERATLGGVGGASSPNNKQAQA